MPKGKHSGHKRGKDHYRWNEGRMVASSGYVKLRVGRDHPLADSNGYAYEHLVVWVSAGRPRPPRGWLLHHQDEDRTHNEIGNLELKRRPLHTAEHIAKKFGRPVLTEEDRAIIRTRRSAGEALATLANEFHVPFQTISKIARAGL